MRTPLDIGPRLWREGRLGVQGVQGRRGRGSRIRDGRVMFVREATNGALGAIRASLSRVQRFEFQRAASRSLSVVHHCDDHAHPIVCLAPGCPCCLTHPVHALESRTRRRARAWMDLRPWRRQWPSDCRAMGSTGMTGSLPSAFSRLSSMTYLYARPSLSVGRACRSSPCHGPAHCSITPLRLRVSEASMRCSSQLSLPEQIRRENLRCH